MVKVYYSYNDIRGYDAYYERVAHPPHEEDDGFVYLNCPHCGTEMLVCVGNATGTINICCHSMYNWDETLNVKQCGGYFDIEMTSPLKKLVDRLNNYWSTLILKETCTQKQKPNIMAAWIVRLMVTVII